MDDLNNVSETSLSAIGVASNGVPLFNPWHNNEDEYTSSRDATTFATFDSCCGHPAPPESGEGGEGHIIIINIQPVLLVIWEYQMIEHY